MGLLAGKASKPPPCPLPMSCEEPRSDPAATRLVAASGGNLVAAGGGNLVSQHLGAAMVSSGGSNVALAAPAT